MATATRKAEKPRPLPLAERRAALAEHVEDVRGQVADRLTREGDARRVALAEGGDSWAATRELVGEREEFERQLVVLQRDMEELDRQLADEAEAEQAAAVEARRAEIVRRAGELRAAQERRLAKLGRLVEGAATSVYPEMVEAERELAALRAEARSVFGVSEGSELCRAAVSPFPVDVPALLVLLGRVATDDTVRRGRLVADVWIDAVPDLRGGAPLTVDGVEAFVP